MRLKLNKCHICEKDFDNLEVHFAAIHDNITTNTDEEQPEVHDDKSVSKIEKDDELEKFNTLGSIDLLSHFTKVKCDSWT